MKNILMFITILTTITNATVLMLPKEAMQTHFSEATIKKTTVLLTAKKHAKAQKLVKTKINSKISRFFIATNGNEVLGYGGIVTTLVRTKNSTALVVLNSNGSVKAVEVVAFYEPKEYIPSKKWLSIFTDKEAKDNLKLKRNVPVITGATLSAKTLTDSVNTILAIWNVHYKDQ